MSFSYLKEYWNQFLLIVCLMGCSIPNNSTPSTDHFFKLQFYSFPIFNYFWVYWNKKSFTGALELCLVEKEYGQELSDCIYIINKILEGQLTDKWEKQMEAVIYKFKKLVLSDFLHYQIFTDIFGSLLLKENYSMVFKFLNKVMIMVFGTPMV